MVAWPKGAPSQRPLWQELGMSCILAPFYHCDKILSPKATWEERGFVLADTLFSLDCSFCVLTWSK